jgi:hypothetical protein
MQYYEPKFLAYIAVFVSCLSSFAFPLMALLISELYFIIFKGNTSSTFTEDRDKISLYFLAVVIAMGLLGCI